MIRRPAVAGQFYPGSKESLKKTVLEYLKSDLVPKKVLGLAAPHAGYIYSGGTAGKTYASAIIPKKCIVLSPNHTGIGANVAIMRAGEWVTPLGNIKIDERLTGALIECSSLFQDDTTAHVAEHSLEVQLPFLQMREPAVEIAPITIKHVASADIKELGRAIANVIRDFGEEILIVASTDMNHYESQKITEEKDELALEKVLALDPEGLVITCETEDITMCGVLPTAVMIEACKNLGATKAEIISHTTSGAISGDFDAVVGYAGIIVY